MLTSRMSSVVAVAIGGAGLYSPPLCRQKPNTRSRTSRDGVPPLSLTGERTLPDVPEENYWFQRHLAVYRWIAERVGGLDVVDMACGEGYGTAVLARRAARVTGVDANPEAHEHARLKYTRPGVTLRARPRRDVRRARATPSCSSRRSSTSRTRRRCSSTSARSAPGGRPTSRPRTCSRSRPRARRSPATRGT